MLLLLLLTFLRLCPDRLAAIIVNKAWVLTGRMLFLTPSPQGFYFAVTYLAANWLLLQNDFVIIIIMVIVNINITIVILLCWFYYRYYYFCCWLLLLLLLFTCFALHSIYISSYILAAYHTLSFANLTILADNIMSLTSVSFITKTQWVVSQCFVWNNCHLFINALSCIQVCEIQSKNLTPALNQTQ